MRPFGKYRNLLSASPPGPGGGRGGGAGSTSLEKPPSNASESPRPASQSINPDNWGDPQGEGLRLTIMENFLESGLAVVQGCDWEPIRDATDGFVPRPLVRLEHRQAPTLLTHSRDH